MKKSKETLRSAGQAEGFRKIAKIFGMLGMDQASLSDSVSNRANDDYLEGSGVRAPLSSLGNLLSHNDQNQERYLPQTKRGRTTTKGPRMAEQQEPTATRVARIIGIAIYTRQPVVAFEGPALSAA